MRTGRHEGDWELVQVELDDRRPAEVLVTQHSGAEACGWDEVERRGDRPVVYVAHDSHAGYFRAGTRDRTFPDPNDEATGDGRIVRPRVQLVTASTPRWMRWPGRWGRTRARPIPFESDSPRGPAFQGERWTDPGATLAAAAPCAAAAPRPNRAEPALGAAGAAFVLAVVAGLARRRRRRAFGAVQSRADPPQ